MLFRSDTILSAGNYILGMFGVGSSSICDSVVLIMIKRYWIWIILSILCCTSFIDKLMQFLKKNGTIQVVIKLVLMAAILLLSSAAITNSTYSPFIYFNF